MTRTCVYIPCTKIIKVRLDGYGDLNDAPSSGEIVADLALERDAMRKEPPSDARDAGDASASQKATLTLTSLIETISVVADRR